MADPIPRESLSETHGKDFQSGVEFCQLNVAREVQSPPCHEIVPQIGPFFATLARRCDSQRCDTMAGQMDSR